MNAAPVSFEERLKPPLDATAAKNAEAKRRALLTKLNMVSMNAPMANKTFVEEMMERIGFTGLLSNGIAEGFQTSSPSSSTSSHTVTVPSFIGTALVSLNAPSIVNVDDIRIVSGTFGGTLGGGVAIQDIVVSRRFRNVKSFIIRGLNGTTVCMAEVPFRYQTDSLPPNASRRIVVNVVNPRTMPQTTFTSGNHTTLSAWNVSSGAANAATDTATGLGVKTLQISYDMKTTPWADNGLDLTNTINKLSLHDISGCDDTALQSIRFVPDWSRANQTLSGATENLQGATRWSRFEIACSKALNLNPTKTLHSGTAITPNTTSAQTNVLSLTNLMVTCPSGSVMTRLQYTANNYQATCRQSLDPLKIRTVFADDNPNGFPNGIINLDRVPIDVCSTDEAIQGFKLENNSGTSRYAVTCAGTHYNDDIDKAFITIPLHFTIPGVIYPGMTFGMGEIDTNRHHPSDALAILNAICIRNTENLKFLISQYNTAATQYNSIRIRVGLEERSFPTSIVATVPTLSYDPTGLSGEKVMNEFGNSFGSFRNYNTFVSVYSEVVSASSELIGGLHDVIRRAPTNYGFTRSSDTAQNYYADFGVNEGTNTIFNQYVMGTNPQIITIVGLLRSFASPTGALRKLAYEIASQAITDYNTFWESSKLYLPADARKYPTPNPLSESNSLNDLVNAYGLFQGTGVYTRDISGSETIAGATLTTDLRAGSNAISVSYTYGGTASAFGVEWRVKGGPSFTTVTGSSTDAVITGLSPNTAYEIRVFLTPSSGSKTSGTVRTITTPFQNYIRELYDVLWCLMDKSRLNYNNLVNAYTNFRTSVGNGTDIYTLPSLSSGLDQAISTSPVTQTYAKTNQSSLRDAMASFGIDGQVDADTTNNTTNRLPKLRSFVLTHVRAYIAAFDNKVSSLAPSTQTLIQQDLDTLTLPDTINTNGLIAAMARYGQVSTVGAPVAYVPIDTISNLFEQLEIGVKRGRLLDLMNDFNTICGNSNALLFFRTDGLNIPARAVTGHSVTLSALFSSLNSEISDVTSLTSTAIDDAVMKYTNALTTLVSGLKDQAMADISGYTNVWDTLSEFRIFCGNPASIYGPGTNALPSKGSVPSDLSSLAYAHTNHVSQNIPSILTTLSTVVTTFFASGAARPVLVQRVLHDISGFSANYILNRYGGSTGTGIGGGFLSITPAANRRDPSTTPSLTENSTNTDLIDRILNLMQVYTQSIIQVYIQWYSAIDGYDAIDAVSLNRIPQTIKDTPVEDNGPTLSGVYSRLNGVTSNTLIGIDYNETRTGGAELNISRFLYTNAFIRLVNLVHAHINEQTNTFKTFKDNYAAFRALPGISSVASLTAPTILDTRDTRGINQLSDSQVSNDLSEKGLLLTTLDNIPTRFGLVGTNQGTTRAPLYLGSRGAVEQLRTHVKTQLNDFVQAFWTKYQTYTAGPSGSDLQSQLLAQISYNQTEYNKDLAATTITDLIAIMARFGLTDAGAPSGTLLADQQLVDQRYSLLTLIESFNMLFLKNATLITLVDDTVNQFKVSKTDLQIGINYAKVSVHYTTTFSSPTLTLQSKKSSDADTAYTSSSSHVITTSNPSSNTYISEFWLHPLLSNTEYMYRIRLSSGTYTSDFTTPKSFKTLRRMFNLRITQIRDTSVTIEITYIHNSVLNGVTGVLTLVGSANSNNGLVHFFTKQGEQTTTQRDLSRTGSSYTLGSLTPNTTYTFTPYIDLYNEGSFLRNIVIEGNDLQVTTTASGTLSDVSPMSIDDLINLSIDYNLSPTITNAITDVVVLMGTGSGSILNLASTDIGTRNTQYTTARTELFTLLKTQMTTAITLFETLHTTELPAFKTAVEAASFLTPVNINFRGAPNPIPSADKTTVNGWSSYTTTNSNSLDTMRNRYFATLLPPLVNGTRTMFTFFFPHYETERAKISNTSPQVTLQQIADVSGPLAVPTAITASSTITDIQNYTTRANAVSESVSKLIQYLIAFRTHVSSLITNTRDSLRSSGQTQAQLNTVINGSSADIPPSETPIIDAFIWRFRKRRTQLNEIIGTNTAYSRLANAVNADGTSGWAITDRSSVGTATWANLITIHGRYTQSTSSQISLNALLDIALGDFAKLDASRTAALNALNVYNALYSQHSSVVSRSDLVYMSEFMTYFDITATPAVSATFYTKSEAELYAIAARFAMGGEAYQELVDYATSMRRIEALNTMSVYNNFIVRIKEYGVVDASFNTSDQSNITSLASTISGLDISSAIGITSTYTQARTDLIETDTTVRTGVQTLIANAFSDYGTETESQATPFVQSLAGEYKSGTDGASTAMIAIMKSTNPNIPDQLAELSGFRTRVKYVGLTGQYTECLKKDVESKGLLQWLFGTT